MVAALWLAAAPAAAWTPTGATWSDQPVPYWIAADLGPFEEQEDEAVAAIHAAFATWSSVDCTGVRFLYQGRLTAPLLASDGRTVVTLVGEGWPASAPSPSYTQLAVDGAAIVEADVALDAEGASWVTRRADGVVELDLQAGLVAEVGHLLGLGDSDQPDATMNPALQGVPEGRTLSDDDIEGVCVLYPAVLPGTGELGAPCANTEGCEFGMECVFDATETYCAPACPAGVCPDGYACLGFEGRQVCAKGGCGCSGAGPAGLGWIGALLAFLAVRMRPRA